MKITINLEQSCIILEVIRLARLMIFFVVGNSDGKYIVINLLAQYRAMVNPVLTYKSQINNENTLKQIPFAKNALP